MTTLQERTETFIFSDQEPSGITAYDGVAGEAGSDWADIWRYKLPAGYSYVFDQLDTFSAYLARLAENIDAFKTSDGGTFVDDTADANDAGANDVQPYPATQAADDAIYFGHRRPFSSIRVVIGTQGAGLTWTEDWEYYGSGGWTNLTGQSASALTIWTDAAGNVDVDFDVPNDWTKTIIDGHYLYFVRCVITAIGGQASTDPLITSMQIHGNTPETELSDRVRIVYRDPNEESQWSLMGAVRYSAVREFQQQSKLHHLNIGAQIVVPEHWFIVIQARAGGAIIDASSSYFTLNTKRTRFAVL